MDAVRNALRGTPRRALIRGTLVALATFLVLGVVTDLVSNPLFVRMVPRTPLDYAFLTSTAVLAGAYVVQRSRSADPTGDGGAVGGLVAGVLAFGCPICNHLLLALASSSAIMTYFDPLRPLLGVASVGLFAGTIYYRRQRECESCVDRAT